MAETLRVLIVEDSDDDAELILRQLEAKYETQHERVDTAQAMNEALDREKWDVIVSDYSMPRFSGADALHLLGQTGLDIPFILVSGAIGEETAVDAMKAGANDYVDKANLARLLPAVSREIQEAEERRARARAELELRQYEHIVSSTTDLLALIDREFVYIATNVAYLKAFDRTSDELIGKRVADVFGEEVFTTTIKPRAERCLAGEVVRYDDWFEFPAMGRKYMDVTYAPYRGQDATVHGFVVTTRDITARREAEEAVRASESRYRTLYELASEAFLTTLPGGKITGANIAAGELLGYTVDELMSLSGAEDIIAPEVLEETRQAFAAQLREHGQFSGDTVCLHKDGSRVAVALSGKPITVGDQQQLQLIAREITESKKAEEELRKSEGLFRQLAEASQAAIYIVAGPKIMYANPAGERLAGRPLSDLLTIELGEIIHPEDRAGVLDNISRRIKGEEVPSASRQRVLQPNGEQRWVETSTTPIEFDGVPAVLAVIIDITDLVRAEEATQRAREELEGKVEQRMLRRNTYGLTFRELTVLHHVANGKPDKQIATELGISPLTAQNHVRHILTKMDASSRTDASVRAVREGLVD